MTRGGSTLLTLTRERLDYLTPASAAGARLSWQPARELLREASLAWWVTRYPGAPADARYRQVHDLGRRIVSFDGGLRYVVASAGDATGDLLLLVGPLGTEPQPGSQAEPRAS